MKRSSYFSFLPTALLSALLAVAVVGCIATGFDLSLAQSMWTLAALCSLFALVVAFTVQSFHKAVSISLLLAALLLLIYQGSRQPLQLQTLLPSITVYYHRAYGWPVLLEDLPLAEIADLALLRLALIICFFLCWALSRRKNLLLSLLPLSPLLCCFVITDTVPDAKYLYLLLLGLTLLLLTHEPRRQGQGAWGKPGAKLTPAVALLLAALFLLVPQSHAANPLRRFAEELYPKLDSLISNAGAGSSGGSSGSSTGISISTSMDLESVGPKVYGDDILLYATVSANDAIYLRVKELNDYTGTQWKTYAGHIDRFGYEHTNPPDLNTITIETPTVNDFLYVPCFAAPVINLESGQLKNTEGLRTYSFDYYTHFNLIGSYEASSARYRRLSQETLSWAEPLAAQLVNKADRDAEKAQKIADYVKKSAAYDLNTQKMPAGETDFARWFLEDSDTGYCVHFATAAVVLLRAANVHARYVEGVVFQAESGQRVAVTEASAHAWVEYYNASTDRWEVLEVTPSDGIPGDPIITPDPDDGPTAPDEPDGPDVPEVPEDDPDAPENQPNTPDAPVDVPDGGTPDLSLPSLPPWLASGLRVTAVPILGLIALAGQSHLRIAHKKKRWNWGNTNRQALERFRQCDRLAKILRLKLPEPLIALAQKARFSQHTLTEAELAPFDAFHSEALSAIQQAPWYRQLIYKIIFAPG